MPEITMGGGIGFSSQATIRAVSEKAKIRVKDFPKILLNFDSMKTLGKLAMPENKIGFFTDVSSSYFLQKLKPGAGKWMALTGSVISGEEAVNIGTR